MYTWCLYAVCLMLLGYAVNIVQITLHTNHTHEVRQT